MSSKDFYKSFENLISKDNANFDDMLSAFIMFSYSNLSADEINDKYFEKIKNIVEISPNLLNDGLDEYFSNLASQAESENLVEEEEMCYE